MQTLTGSKSVRVGLLGLLGMVLLWCISHLAVSTLLRADTEQRLQRYLEGGSPYTWTMQSASDLVGGEIHGTTAWRVANQGLSFRLDHTGVTVPLHLHGERLSTTFLNTLEIHLDSTAAAHVTVLLGDLATQSLAPQAEGLANDPNQALRLTLPAGIVSDQLALFFRADQVTEVNLHAVQLRSDACAAPPCVPPVATLPFALRPEYLLSQRDAAHRLEPQSIWLSSVPSLSIWTTLLRASERVRWALPLLALLLGSIAVYRRWSGAEPARRSKFELIAVCLPVVCALLLGWPRTQATVDDLLLPVVVLSVALLLGDVDPRAMVWRGGLSAWRGYLPATLLIAGILIAIALQNPEPRWPSITDVLRYLLWSTVQQLLLIRFIAPRLAALRLDIAELGLFCGLLFASLHLPNFSLSVLTAMAGAWWGIAGHRHRALLPAVISHTLLGLMVVAALPDDWLRSAEVGARFVFAPQ